MLSQELWDGRCHGAYMLRTFLTIHKCLRQFMPPMQCAGPDIYRDANTGRTAKPVEIKKVFQWSKFAEQLFGRYQNRFSKRLGCVLKYFGIHMFWSWFRFLEKCLIFFINGSTTNFHCYQNRHGETHERAKKQQMKRMINSWRVQYVK